MPFDPSLKSKKIQKVFYTCTLKYHANLNWYFKYMWFLIQNYFLTHYGLTFWSRMHYLAEKPKKLIEAYIGSYLRDEIISEAKIRNINAFNLFLEAVAFSNGEIVNYTNIASECGVSSVTVKEYFQILEDTLIGRFVPSFQKKPKRRVILAPKFYYFDIGIANFLLKRGSIEFGSEAFGSAFEHFIYQELYAHSSY